MEYEYLAELEFVEKISIKKIDDDTIYFSNGSKLYSNHIQDCCEYVHACFEVLEDCFIMEESFDKIIFEKVENSGIRMGFRTSYGFGKEDITIYEFIPCYNEQNGYYSSDLSLCFVTDKGVFAIDVSDCVEDCID